MEEITIILGHRSLKKTIIMNTKLWFLDGTKIMLLHPLLKSLVYSGAATFAWNDLKSCFSRVDRVWVESLQHEMLTFRQNSPYVYDYFTKLKWFWKELETFVPIQNCTCNAWCQCDAKCVFLGYKQGMKGFVELDLTTHEIVVSKHVMFEEHVFGGV